MNPQLQTPLGKYKAIFAGSYLVGAMALGILQLMTGKSVTLLGLLIVPGSAAVTLYFFAGDQRRGLDLLERLALRRFGLWLVGVMSLIGGLIIKRVYDHQLMNQLFHRTMPLWFLVLVIVVALVMAWVGMWLVYSVVNDRYLPEAAASAPSGRSLAGNSQQDPPLEKQRVLVIGSGGREHALAWKLAQSKRVSEVLVAPGNAGTAREAKCRNVDVATTDIDGLVALVRRENVNLTVVGPEGPLVAGIVDQFRTLGLRIFGPTAAAAQLEGSKAFAKDFLARHKIPTGYYQVFDDVELALAHVRDIGAPIVIKADGLAAGKGVVVAMNLWEAEDAIQDMLQGNVFGAAGSRVVIEEFLEGEEASFIAIVDGKNILPMATSQDHKRVRDGDTGPNTGGMGAYSPAPVVTEEVHKRIMREVLEPTVRGMAADGVPFTGFLYAGLMIDDSGAPKVIEFNVRFGDPETQPVLMRLQSDLLGLLEAAVDQRLNYLGARWNPRPALGVVMAAANYPDTPRTGDVIRGLEASLPMDAKIFHAGTKLVDGQAVTAGGRVLCVCALGQTVAEAQMQAYEVVDRVGWDGEFHRKDIGWRAIARERA